MITKQSIEQYVESQDSTVRETFYHFTTNNSMATYVKAIKEGALPKILEEAGIEMLPTPNWLENLCAFGTYDIEDFVILIEAAVRRMENRQNFLQKIIQKFQAKFISSFLGLNLSKITPEQDEAIGRAMVLATLYLYGAK